MEGSPGGSSSHPGRDSTGSSGPSSEPASVNASQAIEPQQADKPRLSGTERPSSRTDGSKPGRARSHSMGSKDGDVPASLYRPRNSISKSSSSSQHLTKSGSNSKSSSIGGSRDSSDALANKPRNSKTRRPSKFSSVSENKSTDEADAQPRRSVEDDNSSNNNNPEEGNESAEALLSSMLKPRESATTPPTQNGSTSQPASAGIDDTALATDDAALDEEIRNAFLILSEAKIATSDPTLGKLKSEYNRLYRIFNQSRDNEKRMARKCKDLTAELTSNATKVQAALKLSQRDRLQIAGLKKELKQAWGMVESSSEKEARSKDVIASLKAEVEELKSGAGQDADFSGYPRAVETNAPLSARPKKYYDGSEDNFWKEHYEDDLKKLNEEKEELALTTTKLQEEADMCRNTIIDQDNKISTLTTERTLLDHEIHSLKDMLSTKKSEQDRDARMREKLDLQIRGLEDTISHKDEEIESRLNEIRLLRDTIMKNELALRDEKSKFEKYEKEKDHLNTRISRLQQEYEDQVMTTTKLVTDHQIQQNTIKEWQDETNKCRDEIRNFQRIKDSLSKKLRATEENKAELEHERDSLKGIIHNLQRDLELRQRDVDHSTKQIEDAKRDRDLVYKNFVKATGATQKQANIVRMGEQTRMNLEHEIQGYKDEASKMRKIIFSLEKERDKYINDIAVIQRDLTEKDEDVKMREMSVLDLKKKISELDRKLKEQQTLYESVRTERNMYSKNLIEANDDIVEKNRKTKIMMHQIEQLKEEISTKEQALVKEHFEHSKLEKEKESLSAQIAKIQQQYEESQKVVQNQVAEENKLRHIITQADAEKLKHKKEYDAVIQERDILGTQLIRRNDELSLLYEKIKIQTSTLNKGEIQYRERLEDIRVLKLEIKKLRREKAILQSETQNVEALRSEIFRIQRDLLRERTRVKVLEEELESPMNIHRWRKLGGSDPSTFELITKIQALQKRLIAKTEEVVEKELIIQQKEKMYKEIKQVLQRQPGPELYEELRVVKVQVKHKTRENKSLASELNMYHSQINEYKYEIERVNREHQDLKRKYYESMKKGREMRTTVTSLERALMPNKNAAPSKFTGGGFNLSSFTTKQEAAAAASAAGDKQGPVVGAL